MDDNSKEKYKAKFTERLKLVMKERDLRQVDVIRLAEPYYKKYGASLNKAALSQYLSKGYYPNLFNFSLLCMALDVPMEWMCGIDDIEPSEKAQPQREYKTIEERISILEGKVEELMKDR